MSLLMKALSAHDIGTMAIGGIPEQIHLFGQIQHTQIIMV